MAAPLRATSLQHTARSLAQALLEAGHDRESAILCATSATAAALFSAFFKTPPEAPKAGMLPEVLPPELLPSKWNERKSQQILGEHASEMRNAVGTLFRQAQLSENSTNCCPTMLARLPGELLEYLQHTPLSGEEDSALRATRLHSGAFYTPQALVAEICRLAEPAPTDSVLDPAMGCGHFLLGVVDLLEGCLPHAALMNWAREHLHGWDKNSAAVATARLCLWLRLSRPGSHFIPPAEHLQCRDTLLTAPQLQERFSCIVGNPPYDVLTNFGRCPDKAELAAKLRASGQYRLSMQGQINLYRCFIEQSMGLLQSDGRLCFIVPATLAADRAAGEIRNDLLQHHAADEFRFLAENDPAFPGICQATVIFRARKDAGPAPAVLVSVGERSYRLPHEELSDFDYTIPRCSEKELALLRWVKKHCPERFGGIVDARVGEVDQTVYRDCIRSTPTGTLLLRGCHLQAFRADLSEQNMDGRYLDLAAYRRIAGARYAIVEPLVRERRIVQMGIRNLSCRPRLLAALLPAGVYCGNSVNVYLPRKDWSQAFIAGLLNSSLYDTLFRLRSANNNINLHEILALPLPSANLLLPDSAPVRAVEESFHACEAEASAISEAPIPQNATPPSTSQEKKKPVALRNRLDVAVYHFFSVPEELRL